MKMGRSLREAKGEGAVKDKSTSSPTVKTTKQEIRRLAAKLAVGMIGVQMLLGLYFGNNLAQAASGGVACAAGGLATWVAYHLVSRRNDGLALFVASSSPALHARTIPFLSLFVAAVCIGVVIGAAIGLIYRATDTRRERAKSDDPLFDADVDRPLAPKKA
jgi:hypothetical protein